MDRVFEYVVVAALGCLGALGITRGMMLSARGVRILAIDRQRTPGQALADLAFVLCFFLWVFEALALALPLSLHLVPAAMRVRVIQATAAKLFGVLSMLAGIAIYGLALRAFGSSWRLGIDRNQPGPLVTRGIFAYSRNPVYLGLMLLAIGVFLVIGRLEMLLLAIAWVVYFHFLILREEQFLKEHYGDAYRDYARRVGRWWTVAGSGR